MRGMISVALSALCLISTAALANPVKLGGSAFGATCGSITTGTTIVSATDNVAGITITSGTLTADGTNEQTILEAVYSGGATHIIWMLNTPSGLASSFIPYPIFIPAGVALVCIPSIANSGGAFITYDLYAD